MSNHRCVVIAVCIALLTVAWWYFGYEPVPPLTFSNTQTLGEPHKLASEKTGWGRELLFTVAPPPSNHSQKTKAELAELHRLVASRTPEMVQQIENNIVLTTADWVPSLTEAALFRPEYRATRLYINDTQDMFLTVVLGYKLKYDRVRPSYLDPSLEPIITTPAHPAYPSGHAAQSRLMSLLLGALMPEEQDAFIRISDQIAFEREVAGVHYKSDSTAGQQLAEDYYEWLLTQPQFIALQRAAQAEWKNDQ